MGQFALQFVWQNSCVAIFSALNSNLIGVL